MVTAVGRDPTCPGSLRDLGALLGKGARASHGQRGGPFSGDTSPFCQNRSQGRGFHLWSPGSESLFHPGISDQISYIWSDLNSRSQGWEDVTDVVFSFLCRFITKRGLKVCADPQVEWVKKAIKTVNNSARRNVKQTEPVGASQPTHTAVTLTG